MTNILKDKKLLVLKKYKEIKLSSLEINKIRKSVNKNMNDSKFQFNKREQESI